MKNKPLLLLPMILISCAFGHLRSPTLEIWNDPPVDISYLNDAFTDGSIIPIYDDVVEVRVIHIGSLSVPNGRIVATDPLTYPERSPFSFEISTGEFPVLLSLVQSPGRYDPIIAAAKLQIKEVEPVEWYLALVPGQDPNSLEAGEFFGFPVDSGTASFMTPEAAECLQEYLFTAGGQLNYGHLFDLNNEMEANVDEGRWAFVQFEDDLTAFLFTSGYGDGVYPAYWGFDENDALACLVIDFGVFIEE